MPRPPNSADLTGRRRYREGWRGKVILEVEEKIQIAYSASDDSADLTSLVWRDAKIRDLHVLDWYDRDKAAKAAGLPPPAPPEHYAIKGGG